jgi:hypothetical protein
MVKKLTVLFAVTAAAYFVAFIAIEHRRTRHGPWRVDFTNTVSGAPMLRVNQPALGITNVQIILDGAQLPPAGPPLNFAQPQPVPFEVPFGRCVFMDTTFLPGTLAFELSGHEIQLLPRVLTVDKKERPWHSGETITIDANATEK